MTDNEIIKALECCAVGTFACIECPCFHTKRNLKINSCRFELIGEALDLVNRQKKEIEILQNRTRFELYLKQKAEIEKKDIEIDILIRKKEALNDEISNLKAEVEKYENIKTTINQFWDILLQIKFAKRKEPPTLEELAEALEEIKSEAIKEFAERLKAKFNKEFRLNLLEKKFIDDLVKEMTEVSNEKHD